MREMGILVRQLPPEECVRVFIKVGLFPANNFLDNRAARDHCAGVRFRSGSREFQCFSVLGRFPRHHFPARS
jgi:hypothetical protein